LAADYRDEAAMKRLDELGGNGASAIAAPVFVTLLRGLF
jgi:hypothetical protein